MKIAWASDIHLNRLNDRDYLEYKEYLQELSPDILIISGDISEGEKVCPSLQDFNDSFNFPTYFVLGNHDYYWNSFRGVENEVKKLVERSGKLIWLSESKIIQLNQSTALIGIEGWGDGRHGTINLAEGYSNDIRTIKDFQGLTQAEIAKLLNVLGDKYAQKLRPKLIKAVKNYQKVILVTHVPPFIEASLDRDLRTRGEFKLPFYTCKAIGDMLLEVMTGNSSCQLTVLCGHTHEKTEVKILENLQVRVKESGYGTWWNATMIDID
jgi:Icc protein